RALSTTVARHVRRMDVGSSGLAETQGRIRRAKPRARSPRAPFIQTTRSRLSHAICFFVGADLQAPPWKSGRRGRPPPRKASSRPARFALHQDDGGVVVAALAPCEGPRLGE